MGPRHFYNGLDGSPYQAARWGRERGGAEAQPVNLLASQPTGNRAITWAMISGRVPLPVSM